MKVAILGYGDQGRSAYEYWLDGGHEITVCDADPQATLPEGAQARLGPDYLKSLDQFDLLVRTPALHPRDIKAANHGLFKGNILAKVTSVTNEFMRICPSRNIIGVTGTKGKGTTSTLITKILEAAGKRVHLGGNIGIPPLDLLHNDIQPDDWVVLELANFQLIDLQFSPKIAVCLMVVPEHLNWHKDMPEYVAAKQSLFRRQTHEDLAVYTAASDYSKKVIQVTKARRLAYEVPPVNQEPRHKEAAHVLGDTIYFGTTAVCPTNIVSLRGRHNLENVCAAVNAVWDIVGGDIAPITQVITSFTGLEHRLELVRELDGVSYFDDSFGTTPETAIVALRAFAQPKVLILGGSDKGAAYDELARAVKEDNVRTALVIGDTGPAIRDALQAAGYTNVVDGGQTMAEIVHKARGIAQPGDVVLLSTGCASFGMFQNYKDRGIQFKQTVLGLV